MFVFEAVLVHCQSYPAVHALRVTNIRIMDFLSTLALLCEYEWYPAYNACTYMAYVARFDRHHRFRHHHRLLSLSGNVMHLSIVCPAHSTYMFHQLPECTDPSEPTAVAQVCVGVSLLCGYESYISYLCPILLQV